MKTYSLKQLVGGFLLVLIFIILFVVNVTFKSDALNIKMFLNPILVSLAICMLIYVIKLNELINLNKSKLNQKDKFELKSCPHDYKQIVDVTTINNKKIKNKKCDSTVHGTFYLNGDKNICGEGRINDLNGCFNKYKLRKIKCDKINKYFEDRDKNILSNWVEYRNNCT
tara:strand:- start:150 stop:656 length:507 start_codon:yes stop_codon:yes gene_type:complete